jgi:hypothetical protein
MKRIIAALALVCLAPGLAPGQGLDIKRFRPAYSVPPGSHGPTRVDADNLKVVPGDVLYAEYAIVGLASDPKTGKVNYDVVLELIDNTGKNLMRRPTPNSAVPQLGGGEMPGDLYIVFGENFAVGKYTAKLTVTDKVASKTVVKNYPVQVVPKQLAFVHVEAMAMALVGDPVGVRCLVTGHALDKKMCNVDVTIRLLDAGGKEVATPVKMNFPGDLAKGGLDKENLTILPVVYPLTPNRPGQFVFELTAVDKNAKNATVELKLPLQVLDVGGTSSK